MRGDTYYFRYVLPAHIRNLRPSFPAKIKRSLRTDSYSIALTLASHKRTQIKQIQNTKHVASIEKLFQQISDFSLNLIAVDEQSKPKESPIVPTLSEAWPSFIKWKGWTDKQGKANQRVFDNLLFFLSDVPVDKVTKSAIRKALSAGVSIAVYFLATYFDFSEASSVLIAAITAFILAARWVVLF